MRRTTRPTHNNRRGHRQLGRRRWDDAVQHTTEMESEAPWQVMAQDRAKRRDLEPHFVAWVTHTIEQHVVRLTPGWHMPPQDAEWL